jgi:hypothetical protein
VEQGSKIAWANSLQDPNLKIPNTKRVCGVVQGVDPKFKPWYCKKKKNGGRVSSTLSLLMAWKRSGST